MATPEKPSSGAKGGEIFKNLPESVEVAAYNVLPLVEGVRFLAAGKSMFAGFFHGLVLAFGYSFLKDMAKAVIEKGLGGGGH